MQTSEVMLLSQIKEMVKDIDIDNIVKLDEFKKDIEAVQNYSAMMGKTQKIGEREVRNYIKHIIENGSDEKKRAIIKSFSHQFTYLNKLLVKS